MNRGLNPLTESQLKELEKLCLEFENDSQAGLTRVGELLATASGSR